MIFFTMPYVKTLTLVLFCVSSGCYARNVVPKHNNKNFENNNNEHVKTIYKRMQVEKTELDHSRHLSHDHPPIMVNNVSVALSSKSVHQGGVIDITFTSANGAFPSNDDFLMIVNDDVVFNTTNNYQWSAPDSDSIQLGSIEKYNSATSRYEFLYDNTTGVLRDFILPYYPAKLKAIIYTPGDSVAYGVANYILGESQVFETIDSDMTIVATQKDRQVTFKFAATSPISTNYYSYAIILDKETVPDRMNLTTFYSFEFLLNFTSFPEDTDGLTVATFGGSDKNWPKGDYKLIAWVYPAYYSTDYRYHIAVSNTISVERTVCKQNMEQCKQYSDCCAGNDGYFECKKFKKGLFGLRTVKRCAKYSY